MLTKADLKVAIEKIKDFDVGSKEPEGKEELDAYILKLAERNAVITDIIGEVMDTILVISMDPRTKSKDLEVLANTSVHLSGLLQTNAKLVHWATIKMMVEDDPIEAMVKTMQWKP